MKVKRSPFKRKRNWRRLWINLAYFFFLMALLAAGYLFFQAEVLKIKNLSCFVGLEPCPQTLWAEIFDLVAEKKIISFSQRRLTDQIRIDSPQYEVAEINFKLPGRLMIKLRLRKPLARLMMTQETEPFFLDQGFDFDGLKGRMDQVFVESEWLVDEAGVVSSPEMVQEELPWVVVATGEEIELEVGTELAQLAPVVFSFLETLEEKTEFNYAWLAVVPDQAIVIGSEWGAFFSLAEDTANKVDSLQLILSRSKIEGKVPRIIDLRFDKPVVVF